MKRVLTIVATVIFLIVVGAFLLKHVVSQRYLAKENSNFEQSKEKSKLNCDQLPIHCAIRDKNLALLNGVTLGDRRIETLDGWSHTPLYFAITLSDKEAVEILLSKGANSNVYDEQGTPALLYAVETKHYEIAESLLKHGAQVDIEVTDETKISPFPLFIPLGYCVSNNDLKCVLLLLEHGADVDRKSSIEATVKKFSIYEMAEGNSNVSDEIKRLLEKRHNKTPQPTNNGIR